MIHQHTSQEYEGELRALKDRLLSMGGRCEALIREAVDALDKRDADLAESVERTDREINANELEVDDLAIRILALRQPVGRDLRFLVTALKVVTDLERIGDEAVNIAERAGELAGKADALPTNHQLLPEMAKSAAHMLHEALDAFVEENADKAQKVLLMDDLVDDYYGSIMRQSMEYMAQNPSRVVEAMSVCSCAKYLERIADHSTNIAEMVVYMVRGVDVRHSGNR